MGLETMTAKDKRWEILSNQLQRMDMISEVVEFDKDTGKAKVKVEPDPRRYAKYDEGGETYFIDKYTKIRFALTDLANMYGPEDGVPAYYVPPHIADSAEYAVARKEAIEHEIMTGEYIPPVECPEMHRPIEIVEQMQMSFVSVDICGATSLRAKDANSFDRVYEIFFREIGTVVGQFSGSILKATGDGMLVYIDHPSVTARDNAVDMALTFLVVLHRCINPAAAASHLPKLSIRVGADDGPASVRRFQVAPTGYCAEEVISDALNRAAKLQESAARNTLLIGEALYWSLHVQWLERCTEVDVGFADQIGVPGYRTFRVE